MKTMVAVLTLFSLVSVSQAEHCVFRQMDDLAFSAYVEARALRWEIHDDFTGSRDYRHLLRDSEIILHQINDLQNAIMNERSTHIIDREIHSVERSVRALRSHLTTCDFANAHPAHHRPTHGGNGYHFTPETHNVGRIHVDAALVMLDRIDNVIQSLDIVANGGAIAIPVGGSPAIGPGFPSPPAPGSIISPTPFPAGTPPPPSLVPRKSSFRSHTRSVSIPLGKTGLQLHFSK